MDVFAIFDLIGGLALFLFGMHILGEALSKLSGGKMESLLERLTSTPIKGVLLGAIVTAIIQSSSATTVMVVGFVNSGIMKLGQAVGVIMGANIGTTITSWILSLTGLESDAFFIQLLKPTSFSPIMAIIGIVLIMFTKKEKKHNIGAVLIGFAVLMFGMDSMSAAVKPLADVPEFANVLLLFSNPILGMLVGAIFTAIIQSSSASVGILQALCLTGSVGNMTAVPIIMGQNIGTCATTLISSIGAGKNAKRAALVHFYFNLIGTIVFMLLFYALHGIFDFAFMSGSATPVTIAIVHTTFNVFATLLLFPFRKLLEKLATFSVKDDPNELVLPDDFQVLDDHFLTIPAVAMEQCRTVAKKMSALVQEALFLAMKQITDYNAEECKLIEKMEERVDKYEDELGKYLLKISASNLTERDSQTMTEILHSASDFERISDHALNIMESATEMHEKKGVFSAKGMEEYLVFEAAVKAIVEKTFKAFVEGDVESARDIEPLEDVIDKLNDKMKKSHVQRLRKGECTIEMGFILNDITTAFERVSDHCSNIAIGVLQTEEELDAHDYLETLDKGEHTRYREKYLEYKKMFYIDVK